MKTKHHLCIALALSINCLAADSQNHFDPRTANLPISFEANLGQADAAVRFLAHSRTGSLLLTSTEAWLTMSPPQGNVQALRMRLVGANPGPNLEGLDPLPGKANYLVGRDPSAWQTGVSTFAKVKYHDVYPGVDLIYYGNQEKLEYDFTLQPGIDPGVIRLEFLGAGKLALDSTGDLVLEMSGGPVRQHRPRVYQEIAGVRKAVSGAYVVCSATQAAFQVADYDKTRPLIIDPVLSLSQTFGGNGVSSVMAVAVDSQENIYVAGNTTSTAFPSLGPLQTNLASGTQHGFVAKFSSAGVMVYSTYLGGSSVDSVQGIAVDTNGDAFVAGYTGSANFPTTNAFRSTNSGSYDAFVAELNPAGNALVFSTYFGGKGYDGANAVALDVSNNVVIEGYTQSTNLPVANAFQPVYGGLGDAFVAKFDSTGSNLLYATYLGGSDSEDNYAAFTATNTTPFLLAGGVGGSLAVDGYGNAYITGWSYSTNFPVANPYQRTNGNVFLYGGLNEGEDAFLTKLDPVGKARYVELTAVRDGFGRFPSLRPILIVPWQL